MLFTERDLLFDHSPLCPELKVKSKENSSSPFVSLSYSDLYSLELRIWIVLRFYNDRSEGEDMRKKRIMNDLTPLPPHSDEIHIDLLPCRSFCSPYLLPLK